MKKLKDYQLTIPQEDGSTVIKSLSFGMTFLEELEDLTGKDITTWTQDLVSLSDVKKGTATCDIIYCSMKAHDLEHGLTIDYDKYKVRLMIANLDEGGLTGVIEHLFSTIADDTEGKPKGVAKS